MLIKMNAATTTNNDNKLLLVVVVVSLYTNKLEVIVVKN